MTYTKVKQVWAQLDSEGRHYDLPLELTVKELFGSGPAPEDRAVAKVELSPTAAMSVEDGNYTLHYKFGGREEVRAVRVQDGELFFDGVEPLLPDRKLENNVGAGMAHSSSSPTVRMREAEYKPGFEPSTRFRILWPLGSGGMGTVYLAEQIGVGNRHVALKVLKRLLLDDPDFLMRFQDEASSTGRIHHPNVVTIYESAQLGDGAPYIAMEFLEGQSLGMALKQKGKLPITEVSEILRQTARGLNAAHKLGIIHRDLKPDNIFLTYVDDGELVVKVLDFGIAKLRESSTHTLPGSILGTPAYMSPEQASGMKSNELDARSDIYSLAVVVYEMITGRTPFKSDTPNGYLRMHMSEPPPPFSAIAPGLEASPQLEAVVIKALGKKREDRFQSAVEFSQAVAAAIVPADSQLPTTKLVSVPTTVEPINPSSPPVERQQLAEQCKDYHIECAEKVFGMPLPPPSLPPFLGGPHNEVEDYETCGICKKPIKRDETVVSGPSLKSTGNTENLKFGIPELAEGIRNYVRIRKQEKETRYVLFDKSTLGNVLGDDVEKFDKVMQYLEKSGRARRYPSRPDSWFID